MTFRIISLSFLLLFVASCGNTENVEKEVELKNGDNFSVSGTVKGANGKTFYIEALTQNGQIDIANGIADESGHFEITGNIPGFGMYQLRLGEEKDKIIPLTLVLNDKIIVNGTLDNFSQTPEVSGSKWADVMTKYMQIYSTFHTDQEELMKQQASMNPEELTKKFVALKSKVDDFAIAKMKEDPENPFNLILSSSATPTMGFENYPIENIEVLKSVSEAYSKKYPDSPINAALSNQVYQIELGLNQFVANNSGDRNAPEISLPNPDGNIIKLSSLKGKYVLIDFWASWCGPCRRENPNLVRLYNEYKNLGFTIYSVSLDKDALAWKKAIEKDGLIWPNHVSDLKQWESPMVQLYGFNSIPHTVLIDKEGKIIASGLRGPSLEQKLSKLLKK